MTHMNSLHCTDNGLFSALSRWFGERFTKYMLESLSYPSSRYYIRVNTLKTTVDYVIDELRKIGLEVFRSSFLPEALATPIRGPFRINIYAKKVVVDKFTAESVMLGADVYSPGVIRAKNIDEGDLVTVVAPNGRPVAEGVALISGSEMLHRKKGLAVKTLKSLFKAPKIRALKLFTEGAIYDQSLPAMITSRILDPKPGEVIIDMCAAPGGKTTHIAQLTENRATIIAVDRSKNRLAKLEENCRRLNVTCVKTLVHDSRYLSEVIGENYADKVLLDPPCTALGVRPKVFEKRKAKDIVATAEYQRQLLREAVKLVKRGGIIVYSTCTLSVEENELNIIYALRKMRLKLVKQERMIGMPSSTVLKNIPLGYTQRFFPHIHETPGYFIAKLVKT